MFRQANRLRLIASLLVTALLIVIVWRNWSLIADSFDELRSIPAYVVLSGILLVFVTFGLAATSYYFLSFHRLRVAELNLIELASAFINRLVPSGLGGLGVHGVYLHHRRHTVAQATTVVSVNNLTSLVMHLTLLAVVYIVAPPSAEFNTTLPIQQGWVLLGITALIAGVLVASPLRRRTMLFAKHMLESLRHYRTHPQKLVGSAVALTLLPLVNTFILWLMATAVGIHLSFVAVFVVFSIGVFVGAALPTPGGFGGMEAGLIAGFLAFGTSSELAIAAALAFRFITYWFPLLPGGIALVVTQRRQLLT